MYVMHLQMVHKHNMVKHNLNMYDNMETHSFILSEIEMWKHT